MTRIRRILYASDFSPASRPAFARAVALAKTDRAALTIVHVMIPVVPLVGYGYVSPALERDLTRRARAQAIKRIGALVAKAKTAGARATSLVLEGAPADRIVRAARARRADLIVMGTHGRGAMAKLFLGSVAGRVIATSLCPVLTVRGR
ncbi:MAG TPA: universal stress protein [Methylomirabilota bacterium]|jgi:nucleotide-binding universal stress UspA family protein